MSFFTRSTKFLKTRMGVIPRALMENVKNLGLSGSEIDLILKLLAFNINGTIHPSIRTLAGRSGVAEKTYQRAADELQKKNLLTKTQRRGEDGKLESNNYDLALLWKAVGEMVLEARGNQLSLFAFSSLDENESSEETFNQDNSILSRFGKDPETVLERGWFFFPRALDGHQATLGISSRANVVIKYLFMCDDGSGIAKVSISKFAEHLGLSRTTIINSLHALSQAGLIRVESSVKFGRKIRNSYDIRPLIYKLEALEKAEVLRRIRTEGRNQGVKGNTKTINPVELAKAPGEESIRIQEISTRIAELQEQYVPKNSLEAGEIRILEQERSELIRGSRPMSSLRDIITSRMEGLRQNSVRIDPMRIQAQMVCERLNGNWNKNHRFYMKALGRLGATTDRYVAAARELGRNPERYFMRSAFLAMQQTTNHSS